MSDYYSVILPTYNEIDNLPIMIYLLHDTFISNKLKYEVIIVDDNSIDGTGQMAKKLQNHEEFKDHIKILNRPGKLGLGSAYIQGVELCSKDATHVLIMDSDLSHQAKYIPEFIAKMKSTDCDIVLGTRYETGGGVVGWPLMRFFMSQVANFLADSVLNINQSDLTGSFRLYKKDAFEKIIKSIISSGYAFQMEA